LRLVLVEHAQHGVLDLDGDGRAGVTEADLHALTDDLDAAAAGDPPLDADWGIGGDGRWTSGAGAVGAWPGQIGPR